MSAARAGQLRAFLDEDERVAREASGGTVVGEPYHWKPAPGGDEWEAAESSEGDVELLVALRPGLPRPPDVMGGYWGAVASWQPDYCDPDADSPLPCFQHAARHDPARTLRMVAAHRAIVDLHDAFAAEFERQRLDPSREYVGPGMEAATKALSDVVRILAGAYGDPAGQSEP